MYGWEENEQTSYFSDADGSMWYRFSPATNNPQSAPFFIILHGHGNFPPTKFSHPNWNVLNPLDNFGLNGMAHGGKARVIILKLNTYSIKS